jgi:UDP-GlcNAc3NAcA epimerase
MKIASVVGARPQFIKAAPVSRRLRQRGHSEVLIHTGQHYDHEMSQVFFEALNLPVPDYNLSIGSGPHGWQTGQMLARIEEVLVEQMPDWVLVYGDTNSTLAGALAAVKIPLRLAHVEAGLRSRNRTMPEEHNRVLVDHCADLLLCPTQTAVDNLMSEGITQDIHLVGDPMYDAMLQFREVATASSQILSRLGLAPRTYLLATVHRPYNTDVPANLEAILSAFGRVDEPVVFPVHPRTRQRIAGLHGPYDESAGPRNLRMIDPVGYLDMLVLEQNARLILTDSGGLQKEAYFCGVPCVTLRPETEWIETVQAGWNRVVGADEERILDAVASRSWPAGPPRVLFGDGRAAEAIVGLLGS